MNIILALLALASPALLASDTPVSKILNSNATELDLRGTGKPNFWRKFDANGKITEWKWDREAKGRIDEIMTRSPDGRTTFKRNPDTQGRFRETITLQVDQGRVITEVIERNDDNGKPVERIERTYNREKGTMIEVNVTKKTVVERPIQTAFNS